MPRQLLAAAFLLAHVPRFVEADKAEGALEGGERTWQAGSELAEVRP